MLQEQRTFTEAFSGADDFRVDFLDPPVMLARLEERLRGGYHVLHLVAYDTFNKRKEQAVLYLQHGMGQTQIVTDVTFSAMLVRQGIRPRLVVLAACHGATRVTGDAWRGLAPTLVQAGVPAVVAMQGALALPTARAFTGAFYRALLEHGVVDLALNQARSLLISQGQPGVGLPVLVMRLRDGWVFA